MDTFFIRVMNIYGRRFSVQFASAEAVVAAKIEWGVMICKHHPGKIEAKLQYVKEHSHQDSNLAWPNIGAILAAPSSASPTGANPNAYLPAPSCLPSAIEQYRGRFTARAELAKMRSTLNEPAVECRKNGADRRKADRGRRADDGEDHHEELPKCP